MFEWRIKDEKVFGGREAVWKTLMCLAFYFLLELGRQIGKNMRR